MRRAPYIHLTQELVHALTMYGRLSGTEWACVLTVAHYTFGWGRESYPIGMNRVGPTGATTGGFLIRMPQADSETIRRSLRHLSTPATEDYAMSRGAKKAPLTTRGHGILVMGDRAGRDFSSPTVWSIQTDWRKWGWEPDVDLGAVEDALSIYVVEDQPERWTPEAAQLAAQLRNYAVGDSGSGVRVPDIDPDNRVWRRWCNTFQTLLDNGAHPEVVVAALQYAAQDEKFWASRIVGMRADQFVERNWDQLVSQWRAWRNQNRRF